MDKEKFKQAFTSFSEDDFETSREILSKEIDSTINDYFKRELELEGDVLDIEREQPEE